MGEGKGKDHTAAPQASGYLLQLERALYHLSRADHDVTIAVERFDDVAQIKGGMPVLQEQDKNSVRHRSELLGDRSSALWRTLQIWLQQYRERGSFCDKYLLVTNAVIEAGVASMLKRSAGSYEISPKKIVETIRSIGKQKF